MSETEIPQVLDHQEAYLAQQRGELHRPKTIEGEGDDDDQIFCETCGTDLRSVAFCHNVPTGRCGCPLYMILDGEHLPHE